MTEHSVVQYKPRDPMGQVTDTEARITAREMLQAKFEAHGEVMVGDITPGVPEPVVLNSEKTDWVPAPDHGYYDGWVIPWTASGSPLAPTVAAPLSGVATGDAYTAIVDVDAGPVRVVHDLGGPVTVRALDAAGEGVGYMFATEITPNEIEVELAPGAGAATLHVTRDVVGG